MSTYERPPMAKKLWAMVEGYTELKKSVATPQELEAWLEAADREAFPRTGPPRQQAFDAFNNQPQNGYA